MACRVFLITGASRGVGLELAQRVLDRGDTVVGCARGPSGLDHPNYSHKQVDITDEQAVRVMFGEITATQRRLDVLINNAGVSLSRLGLLTGGREFAEVVNVNLVGSFLSTREAIKLMKRNRFGRVINFSSINVPMASLGASAYNASKAAVEALGRTLANECASDDVTINTIGISLFESSGMVAALSPEVLAAKKAGLMKSGLINAAELHHAVEFFAAPEARAITGQTLYFGGVR